MQPGGNPDHQWLAQHPIFSLHQSTGDLKLHDLHSEQDPIEHPDTSPGKTNIMVVRGTDIILAVNNEIRIAPLAEASGTTGTQKTFKVLNANSVDFTIMSLCLSPTGKLLAVSGATQVSVVVLPRSSYAKLVTPLVECKSIRVGQYYHAPSGSLPIAKIDWHPWGEGESSLLVMTSDGTLREYDMAVDAEEPQQFVHFFPPRTRRKGYLADDEASEEVVSFCFGKGKADWGRLTVYALTRTGEVYAICPFLPFNAAVPDLYVQALECFVSTKRSALSNRGDSSSAPSHASTIYDLQYKYVKALSRQLPASSVSSSPRIQSRVIHLHPPTSVKYTPSRQGPFLLQPAPVELGREGTFATDIAYAGLGDSDSEEPPEEPLGLVLIGYSDGNVDVCLDTEKVEALWDINRSSWDNSAEPPLPVFTVWETIDVGLVDTLDQCGAIPLLNNNTTKFYFDPLFANTVYLAHAFGVHSLNMNHWLTQLSSALRQVETNDRRKRRGQNLEAMIKDLEKTEVHHLLNTLDPVARASAPVTAVCILSNVHIPHSLLALTAAYQLVPYDLSPSLSLGSPTLAKTDLPSKPGESEERDRPYISLLEKEEYRLTLSQALLTRHALPKSTQHKMMTTDTLRFLGKCAEITQSKMRELTIAIGQAEERAAMQRLEVQRQVKTLNTMANVVDALTDNGGNVLAERAKRVAEQQKEINRRFDKMLQRLMDSSSGTLSEFEVKWFAELGRMDHEVAGTGDGRSLKDRAAAVIHRHNLLREDMAQIAAQETERKKTSVTPKLGSIQVKGIEKRLAAEHHLLEEGKRKMDDIDAMLSRLSVS